MKALTLMFILGVAAPIAAQTPGASQTAAAPTSTVESVPEPIHIGSHVGDLPTGYEGGGRRDPFTSLIVKRTASNIRGVDGSRARTGLSNVALADVTVRGVIRSGAVAMATLEGTNKQSYTVHPKDRLLDAVVIRIDADGVLFADETAGNTPAQVKKSLRPAGEDIR